MPIILRAMCRFDYPHDTRARKILHKTSRIRGASMRKQGGECPPPWPWNRRFTQDAFLSSAPPCPCLAPARKRPTRPRSSRSCPRLLWNCPRSSRNCPRLLWNGPRSFRNCPRLLWNGPRLSRNCPRKSSADSQGRKPAGCPSHAGGRPTRLPPRGRPSGLRRPCARRTRT
jgi:hypothetical protein